MQAERIAERFDGLPDEVGSHGQVLAAFKAAAPSLGLSPRLVHAVDWLFKFTRPQDWGAGRSPLVWPSAALQQEALGLAKVQVKAINRSLIEAGLISMRDSPNGKRWGVRDSNGRIIEAYGFDLSPLAVRYGEFVQVAAEAKAERVLIGQLRRRVTIARKGIAQILETAAEYGFSDEEWVRLRADSQRLVRHARVAERAADLTIDVGALERRKIEAFERLEQCLKTLKTDPKGSEYRPHIIPTKPAVYPEQDNTVMADERCNAASDPAVYDPPPPDGHAEAEEVPTFTDSEADGGLAIGAELETGQAARDGEEPRITRPPRTDCGPVMRLSPDELARLAPRLRPYLTSPCPAWPEIVEAADWLRGELGISPSLWGEACVAMGREQAAIAVAIVSAKPAAHFRTTPGGYFHGMVAKAKTGQLNLARTVWGLRQAFGPQRPRLIRMEAIRG